MAKIPSNLLREALKGAKVKTVGVEAAQDAADVLRGTQRSAAPPAATTPPVEPPAPSSAPKPPEPPVEAEQLVAAKLEDFDLGADWQPNFDRIQTSDDIKAVIADTAQRNAPKIQEARRQVITNEQLAGLAGDLNIEQDVVRKVIERESGGVLNPETILAARQVLNSSADRLLGLAQKVRSAEATDLDRITFRRQFEFHAEYQRQFMGARAEAGRALNAFAIPVGTDAAQITRLKGIVETLNGHDTDDLARMVTQVEKDGIGRLTREYSQSRVMGTVQELFINSILSGVKTHVVNATGNVLFQGMNIAETAVAARLGRFLSGDEHVMVGEASAQLYGALSGWKDALRLAARAFKTGEPLDAAAKYESQTRRAISSTNLLPADAPLGLQRAVDALGTIIRLPTERVMMPMDEFAKSIAQRSELSRQAYLDAMRKAQASPMSEDEIAGNIRAFMENPPRGTQEAMGHYARYATFQTPMGPAAASITRGLNMIPGARLIAPFVNTPINLLKAGLFERSPLAVFSADFRAAMAEGGPRRDLALARVSMGTLTVGAAAMAASSGAITGGGPQDPKARKILEATGWQPYSIAITDPSSGKVRYQSYARAEPLAYVIGATADAVEMLAFVDYDDELKSESEQFNIMAASIVAGVANNTMSKTFMSGVMDFSEMLSDPKRYAAGWLGGMGQAMIPYSSFRRDISRVKDPYIREAWSFGEKIKASAGIPGYSSGAPPRRDFFGNPQRYTGGSLIGVMSPFPDSKGKPDPVVNEIERVMRMTREVPVAMPGRRIEGLKLTIPEYDELVRIARAEPVFGGNTFKEQLSELIESPAYEQATDDYKRVLLKDIQDRADKAGRALLEQSNPVFAERIANWRLKKSARLYGEAVGE